MNLDKAIPYRLIYFDEAQANPTVPAPRRSAERGNPAIFVTLTHEFCNDSALIH